MGGQVYAKNYNKWSLQETISDLTKVLFPQLHLFLHASDVGGWKTRRHGLVCLRRACMGRIISHFSLMSAMRGQLEMNPPHICCAKYVPVENVCKDSCK